MQSNFEDAPRGLLRPYSGKPNSMLLLRLQYVIHLSCFPKITKMQTMFIERSFIMTQRQ